MKYLVVVVALLALTTPALANGGGGGGGGSESYTLTGTAAAYTAGGSCSILFGKAGTISGAVAQTVVTPGTATVTVGGFSASCARGLAKAGSVYEATGVGGFTVNRK